MDSLDPITIGAPLREVLTLVSFAFGVAPDILE